MKKLVIFALGFALMLGGQTVHAMPTATMDAVLTSPDCQHLVSTVTWDNQTAHFVEHVFKKSIAITDVFVIPVAGKKRGGTAVFVNDQQVWDGEQWLVSARLQDKKRIRFFSTSSNTLAITGCPRPP